MKVAFRLVVGMCLLALVGCAGNNYPPPGTVQEYDYIVGPGDNLEIFVWGNPELSTSATVRPDGKFTTRLVEDLRASGMTSTELAREIERAYGRYVKNPVVSVIVKGFVGVPTQQVRVVGEAAQPTNVPFRKHMTVLDLMIAVGGLNEFANGNKSVLVRYTDGEQKVYNLRLEDLLEGDIAANTPLMPGDIVIIPEAWF
ncbi:MAG: sugar ABC transporter substrate-binding protein [Gammaproteobacteria bacterium]|uniref:XrtA/PEP-CTERM system exopolysaccharide export protein n=1 Tax=Pseudomaricurvus alcaniphilus TaxID=1166482 RepID=UPI00140DC455|nr:XrtA/PEP-CTERM system exopolysaccharide export protein [Pseudomaricurvus alcaniphilus]MBR9912430.1 sugar ABC transporter substrate-binding protein [Gammaproteobacteria bacterium]NHN36737.1 sugar ABC transporter substrate-binding protein [Pseudomaricurvus alcaniphilus]